MIAREIVVQAVLDDLVTRDDILDRETLRGHSSVSQFRAVTWWAYCRLNKVTPREAAKMFDRDPTGVTKAVGRVDACPALKKRATEILRGLRAASA